MIEEKKVSLMKVDTLKNVSDSLTKSVSTKKFSWCRGSMGIVALDFLLCNPITPYMQRKQQVGEFWICVILFSLCVKRTGGLEGGGAPRAGVRGQHPQEKNYASRNVTPTSRNMSCI
jgi:hypothetical protein